VAYQLIEKKRFVNKLVKLLQYLENEWGYKVAANFQANIDRHFKLIIGQPFIGAPTGRENVRSLLITRHNRLFYKISGNKIIIINLYDTRMNPKKNPYTKK
jgi:plasmid stabilization system protein ParE